MRESTILRAIPRLERAHRAIVLRYETCRTGKSDIGDREYERVTGALQCLYAYRAYGMAPVRELKGAVKLGYRYLPA